MINWKGKSFDQIKLKWENFTYCRRYPSKCTRKTIDKAHITCLERESLINDLLDRLESANRVIDSYGKLNNCLIKEKNVTNAFYSNF